MMIEIYSQVTDEFVDACSRLLPQLSSSTKGMSWEAAEDYLGQEGVYQFVYRREENGPILGMLTLVTFTIPTGKRAWIEDVVVDEQTRGEGAGRQLVDAAVAHAQKLGMKSIDLTSRPTRVAANRLYQSAGFAQRETNIYRYNG
ncbi:GNAT family N-acetyltransferase [Actinotignum urinale]|uniref:GNAT family N-acetyltransferase n=1 Tax=Actinotignum urinale TaxID=190146 RepID=A0AAW9HWW2_9ACTO|nr:GNAT family N-acetyltransferase [Actinotignum urinale]MDY5129027.1 GNAT family N-acetyltransferase [Actinotignum urinale]MDY5132418.1 GNAT family N-acetyltransferase [Actinotignum urinale]MDY5150987.1 GNAT family N-acetyltransferase [Actinotignum urinale]MDY5154827.1 GNAT family N-acetyltransferase [Actinotignum urinale]WIK59818.1 GNAT family N-acetyltransferase [Actinotignum urinale]